MNGSYSIKYVLPVLVPEFEKAYKELDGVQKWSQAMNAFARLGSLDEEKLKLRNSLLEYCNWYSWYGWNFRKIGKEYDD